MKQFLIIAMAAETKEVKQPRQVKLMLSNMAYITTVYKTGSKDKN